ncbi:type II toxin-antitoxin system Phd/YefM family antitoxin [Bacillus sp. SD075]|uniref:type II toxin-antitoxin system prevent-host-death family antitoxin n=1 Tax=Bacillus sp. SD075 TaxID=2781732 RepID=UPI001A96056C|nr:type II toxin-antitoxin system prevent-host-death family antitoxin [Bacillus sp. SD075]MBO1000846.1 type II toxin-antitoxin system Phd/YefM family antitoxin [Bacillus sp. SD075]
MDKPAFTIDQIIKASDLVRKFSEIRKKAKDTPYFITDNGNVETVLLSYDKYEELYQTFLMFKEMEKRMEELEQQITDYRMERSEKNPDELIDWRSIRRTANKD